MLGELFNSVMDEVADDPETRRILAAPFKAASAIFHVQSVPALDELHVGMPS